MVYLKTSIVLTEEQQKAKEELEVGWRYLINKGIIHCKECMPRQEEINDRYAHILKNRTYSKIVYYIKEKYPEIWDEMLKNGTREVN